jgi:hypothetical protein
MAGHGARLLVGAPGTHRERRACRVRHLTQSGTARDGTFTGVCEWNVWRCPCQDVLSPPGGANQALCRRCARPNGRRKCHAPPNTPRDCLDNPPAYNVAGSRRPATRSRACASAASSCAPNESQVRPCRVLAVFWPFAKSQIRILVTCLSKTLAPSRPPLRNWDGLPRHLLLPLAWLGHTAGYGGLILESFYMGRCTLQPPV